MTDDDRTDPGEPERSAGDADPTADDGPEQRPTTSDHTRSMTDDTDATERPTAGTERPNTDPTGDAPDGDTRRISRLSTGDLRGLLDRVGLAALSLLAIVAGWGFYSQSGDAIRTWFDPAYQSIALAVFNLAVLFVALAGMTHQLRRIRANRSEGAESVTHE